METQAIERNSRKVILGKVVSNKMQKTIVVSVERKVMHPKYGKFIKMTSKFKAHDEKNECNINDIVKVMDKKNLTVIDHHNTETAKSLL